MNIMKHEDKYQKKSLGIRLLGATASLMLISSAIYIAFVSINLTSSLLMASAFGGLVVPSAIASNGFLECLIGTLEVFIEGIQSVLAIITELISTICS
jgi:hypothetical protein